MASPSSLEPEYNLLVLSGSLVMIIILIRTYTLAKQALSQGVRADWLRFNDTRLMLLVLPILNSYR